MQKKTQTMTGNNAASYVAYAFTDVAAIYPITPSSDMAELVDSWAANGKKNIFGQTVLVSELESEAGAAGAMHGALSAGALASSFTASQGLLLMIPNMYKMSGELLPGVLHVSARALSAHALSIFGDHQDVMACRQTGFGMLASGSVQEIIDLGGIAHLAAIKGRVPFLHFFDGFRTSHELQNVALIEYEDFAKMVDWKALNDWRTTAMNPEHPFTKGTAQNPDIYFQAAEASNIFYIDIVDIVADYMKQISVLTGRTYKPFDYYGATDAERVIIAMGSITETAEETVDYLVSKGEKVGLIKVRLYRPFSPKYLFDVMPKTVKKIAVLDRTKEKGALYEPLHLDILGAYIDVPNKPVIVGGRYGLASKDTTPSMVKSVFDNLKAESPKNNFTVGIVDDITHLSLPVTEEIKTEPEGTIRCKFWGFGSDGTVGANKSAIKIIGDNTDMYAQAYFAYDSKKSGGVTISHLRFGKKAIKSAYLISDADFISCSKQSYMYQYDLLKGLKKGGTFLLNCLWNDGELDKQLPAGMKRFIAKNEIQFYTINATGIAQELGLGGRINMIMQSAFFKLAEIIPIETAVEALKKSIVRDYGKKGEDIVKMNYAAVDRGIESLHNVTVPAAWAKAEDVPLANTHVPPYVRNVLVPINKQEGDALKVSTFVGVEDGRMPNGTSRYEKRGVAVEVPHWIKENCIQCNQCSFVCPHAVIRPFLLDEKERTDKPENFETVKAAGKGFENLEYRMQVSVMDCTGCSNCANICPAKNKALVMKPLSEEETQSKNWDYAVHKVSNKYGIADQFTVKGSQFKQPLLEFHGACAGCGETAYATLVTQLFGDRMMIANASGCSSIWGGSYPAAGFTYNEKGKGPAWASSLFEDNANYGYGMALGTRKLREQAEDYMQQFIALNADTEFTPLFKEWIETKKNLEANIAVCDKIKALFDAHLKPVNTAVANSAAADYLPQPESHIFKYDTGSTEATRLLEYIYKLKDFLVKKSVWSFGGDGWAYDIGYGGLDHTIASGEDFNILVFDTEVYSNTGGQSSKSTPTAAVAKFAAGGKRMRKKDLGAMLMTYGYVYVAQVALGANMNQLVKALKEAESYDGPSIVICYAPCINHGLRSGMAHSVEQEKKAVESGYWHLYRFDPRLKEAGKNPFQLDSKEPTASFQEFINSEVRYTSLKKTFPNIAEDLFAAAEQDAKERYARYKKMSENQPDRVPIGTNR